MEKAVDNNQSFRFERKFVLTGVSSSEVESYIKLHPALFNEIHWERTINNIYFDTHDFRSYRDNIDGNAKRKKVRIRWYGNLFGVVSKPKLEYKLKQALVGRKESYRLKPFRLDTRFNYSTILGIIEQSKIPASVKQDFHYLQPALMNQYKRKYYLSADMRYRLTVDRGLSYYNIKKNHNAFLVKFEQHRSLIIELKYPAGMDNDANRIATLFPFRLTKSSKYVNGIELFYGPYF